MHVSSTSKLCIVWNARLAVICAPILVFGQIVCAGLRAKSCSGGVNQSTEMFRRATSADAHSTEALALEVEGDGPTLGKGTVSKETGSMLKCRGRSGSKVSYS